MRLPLVLAAALLLTSVPQAAAACEGSVTPVTVVCNSTACVRFYLVMGTPNFALYEESNGIANLQRGGSPVIQGGHDNCFQGPHFDMRIL